MRGNIKLTTVLKISKSFLSVDDRCALEKDLEVAIRKILTEGEAIKQSSFLFPSFAVCLYLLTLKISKLPE